MFEKVLAELAGKERVLGESGRDGTEQKIAFTPLPAATSLKACFVDGGNAPVFESPEVRVEYLRIYGTVYDGKERKTTEQVEGSVLVRRTVKDGKGYVAARGYAPIELDILIPDDDPGLRFGKERVSLGIVANLARFVLECRFLQQLGKKRGCALLVRDGPLIGNNEHEDKALQALFGTGKQVAGLCKTNTKLTKHGGSATAYLMERGPKQPWIVSLESEEGVDINVVKLHARSEYAFRLDTRGEREKRERTPTMNVKIAASLVSVSADPAFYGYPYPLIEADRMARVTNREIDTLRMRFRAEAGEGWKSLERMARGSDAHSVLDRMG